MKRILLLLILLPSLSFSQNITKRELSKMIMQVIKINKGKTLSYQDLILVSDNTDSIFFNAKNIKIFTDRKAPIINNFCRRLEINFVDKNVVHFTDCQNCTEPSSCSVTTEKTIYKYKVVRESQALFLVFENKFEIRKYQISDTKRDAENNIMEFRISKI